MPDSAASRPSLLALASLVVGGVAAALLGMGGLGLVAMFLGWLAIRAINGSDGRLRGRGLAATGIILGAASLAIPLFGFLAVIVLPSWEASHRAECLNHLRIIGQAVNSYYDMSAGAPGMEAHYPQAAVPNRRLAPQQRLSWLVELIPYLQTGDSRRRARSLPAALDTIVLNQAWSASANETATNAIVPIFLCPSHPNYDARTNPGESHYVGISGIDPASALLPTSDPRAGALGFDRIVTYDDVSAGVAYTMLAIETTVHNGHWIAAGEPTLRGVDPDLSCYIGTDARPFGGCHPHGANLVHVDGSATFLSEKVSARRFRGMAALGGLELLEPAD